MRSAKKLTTSFISLLLMVSLTGCQNEPTSQPVSSTGYTPGTYEGVGAGMNGEVHVAVTFDKDSITCLLYTSPVRLVLFHRDCLAALSVGQVEKNYDYRKGVGSVSYTHLDVYKRQV